QRLLEGQRCGIDGFGRHRAITERLQQLGGDGRQRGRLGSWFAWHRHSLASCYAPNTKLMTGPPGPGLPSCSASYWRSHRLSAVGPMASVWHASITLKPCSFTNFTASSLKAASYIWRLTLAINYS